MGFNQIGEGDLGRINPRPLDQGLKRLFALFGGILTTMQPGAQCTHGDVQIPSRIGD
jgi:hypothetical protein